MYKATRIAHAAFTVNCFATLAFLALLFVHPAMTDLSVAGRYTELDRAGVINAAAFQSLPAEYGFSAQNQRNTVPRFIAAPARTAQRTTAILGAVLAAANVMLAVFWVRSQTGRCSEE